MSVIELSQENFASTASQEGIVMVDCRAGWCGACADFDPVFLKVAEKHPEHRFARLDAQSHAELLEELGITHLPTLLLYRDGLMLLKQPGVSDELDLDDIVRQAESLDMDEVRAQIEAEHSSAEKSEHVEQTE